MTDTVETIREQMVREIIEARPREPVTVEHMARYFPEDFELGADDLAPFTAEPKEVFIAPSATVCAWRLHRGPTKAARHKPVSRV